MEPDDYCDIFCADLMRPRLHRVVGDLHGLIELDNGDGLGFGRIERVHDIFTGTTSIIYYFDYISLGGEDPAFFIVVGFRLVITVYHVDDSEIVEDCL